MLRVRVFGTFAMEADGVALPMPERRRACSLLGWIALHPGHASPLRGGGSLLARCARFERRARACEPSSSRCGAALGAENEGVLVATRDMVGLVGDGLEVDAREFERLVRAGCLLEAADLGDGELLPGLDAEWVYEARESHRRELGEVLARLAADAVAAGELTEAIRISRQRVALDPLTEDAHRQLIRCLIAAGEVSAARVAFDDLARRLRAELRVAPSRETRRLLEEAISPTSVAAEERPPLPAALTRRGRSPFVGREDALGWLEAESVAGAGGLWPARRDRRRSGHRQDATRQ